MSRPELHQTLTALLEALDIPNTEDHLSVTEAEVSVPIEVVVVSSSDGLTAFAAPPESRFESGFMQPIHNVRFRAVGEKSGARE